MRHSKKNVQAAGQKKKKTKIIQETAHCTAISTGYSTVFITGYCTRANFEYSAGFATQKKFTAIKNNYT